MYTDDNQLSNLNSSTTTLGISGVFTGEFEEVSKFSVFNLIVFADKDSAVDGLEFQWSSDGTNIDRTEKTNALANTGRAFTLAHRGPYFRVKYTNGSQGQTIFRLNVIHRFQGTGIITKPLKGSVTDENFAQLVQAPIMGKNDDGTFTNLRYSATRKGFSFTTAQTDTIVWTPASGKKVLVTGYILSASGVTDALTKLFFGTDSENNWLYAGRIEVSVNAPSIIPMQLYPPVAGLVDESVKITTTAAMEISGVLFGYEE